MTQENTTENKQSIGLGDTVEKLTTLTGVKKVVDKLSEITQTPCNCGERKDALNNMFPYNYKK